MIRIGWMTLVGIILFSQSLYAQRKVSFPFRGGYDEEADIQIGIMYNYLLQSYQLSLDPDWRHTVLAPDPADRDYLEGLRSVQSKVQRGFSIGIPIDFKLSQYVLANFSPTYVILNGMGISYSSLDTAAAPILRKAKHTNQKLVGDNFTSFEFPLALKWRSEEKKMNKSDVKYRTYLLGGVRYSKWVGLEKYYREAAAERESLDSRALTLVLKPDYLSWEGGIGVDIYFPFFKVSPEIRFSQSMHNVFDKNHILSADNKYMMPLDKGLIRNIYFSLIFQ